MYNENAELFCRTLYGVMKNIAHLCGRKNSRVWGKDGWQKVGDLISPHMCFNIDVKVFRLSFALSRTDVRRLTPASSIV